LTLQAPWGHARLLPLITRAAQAGRLPQSVLLFGPEGVGKRSIALWTAAQLQCREPSPPCGQCRDCRLAVRMQHPDIHLHFPMPRPKSGTPQKMQEASEAMRRERLDLLAKDSLTPLDEGAATGIYLSAIRNIRAAASKRPVMGEFTVFVIDRAEAMVPQAASQQAANAFLKLLEEPPDFVYILLTSSRQAALLPTIRSRTAPLHVPAPAAEQLAEHLVEAHGADPAMAQAAARQCGGALGPALRLLESGDGDAAATADRLFGALMSGSFSARQRAAAEFSSRGARATLGPAVEELRTRMRDLLCSAVGTPELAFSPKTVESALSGGRERVGGEETPDPDAILATFPALDVAAEAANHNLNPQSTTAVLLRDMSRALSGEPGA